MLKTTLKWLSKHIEFNDFEINKLNYNNPLQLVEKINQILNDKGVEVEEIKLINPLIVTKIDELKRKDGLKVSICQTSLSDSLTKMLPYKSNKFQVLCGAENAKEGMTTILAPLGFEINGFVISERLIRGETSNGMFCSKSEIGEEDSSNGIIDCDLERNTIYRWDDIFFKLSTPTNRWDLMNVRGIARELANAGLGKLKELPCFVGDKDFAYEVNSNVKVSMSFMSVQNISIDENIKILMDKIGENQNSDLKYLNDFMNIDIGHPIHIYDSESVKNINLKPMPLNQKLITLKNKEFIAKENEILIEMNDRPACIGGIMGISGFNNDTQNVIIEAGYFKPENISCLISESAKLFHLGIDFDQETLGYIGTMIKGDISKIIKTSGEIPEKKELIVTYSKIYQMLGLSLSLEKIRDLLIKYGFEVECSRTKREDNINDEFCLIIKVPSWRSDIQISEDIVEEIMRIYGFKDYQNQTLDIKYNNNLQYKDKFSEIRDFLINKGFVEMYNFPFSSCGEIKIINSLNIDKTYLRANLIESLYENAYETLSNGSADCLVFEIGKIYPSEEQVLGILVQGKEQRNWQKNNINYDFMYLKKIIYELCERFNFDIEDLCKLNDENFSFGLSFNNGFIGAIKQTNNIIKDCYYAEINLTKIKNNIIIKQDTQRKIYEDLSIKVRNNIDFEIISKYLTEEYYVFDYYKDGDYINYGITFIFNENILDYKEKVQEIKENIFNNLLK